MTTEGRSTTSGQTADRKEVLAIYTVGLFQGLSLVAFPAAATILTSPSAYSLSKSKYGLLFLPQVLLAIAASLGWPKLARTLSLKKVLAIGLVADVVSMGVLVATDPLQKSAAAYPLLLFATACLGLGFGLTLGSISTYAGSFMPDRRDVALTALNVLLGLGTALSPFLVAIFLHNGHWWYLPLICAVGLVLLLVTIALLPLRLSLEDAPSTGTRLPTLFWLFASVLVLYGVVETMFGNWGTTLLVGHGVRPASANNALAAFWAGVTVGRLVIAVASSWVRSNRVYVTLPWLMAGALLLAPLVKSAAAGIGVFLLGGLACSGFFPMTIGYGESTFPNLIELATGWLIAAYQLGYGVAAFGGGALQSVVSLGTLFRAAAAVAVVMGILSLPIARRQKVIVRARKPVPNLSG
ncbi:MAG TPA: MFS transporter [Acidimicrobiales bacterium]|nr:MFS transporter [Acidimicrobiales bacterium]